MCRHALPGIKVFFLMFMAMAGGCLHDSAHEQPSARESQRPDSFAEEEPEEGARSKGNTVTARIQVLTAQGQFAEARVLIAEASASGLLSKPQAERLLHRITQLSTRLGEIPARLQRAKDFPSQLKDHTLFQIQKMLDDGDFSLATKAQLKEAVKLIKEQARLMEKV
jgi:hypothetical protein